MILAGSSVGVISCKTETNNNESKGYSLAVINADSNKEITTSYSASIEGKQDIDIYPQVSGYIEKLNVSEGDIVRKGEILYLIKLLSKQLWLMLSLLKLIWQQLNLLIKVLRLCLRKK